MDIHQRPIPPNVLDWVCVLPCHRPLTYIGETNSFEILVEAQRDNTPEQAASRLRACPEIHHLDREEAYDSPRNEQPPGNFVD